MSRAAPPSSTAFHASSPDSSRAALLAISHGTSNPEGQRLVAQLAERVSEVAAERGGKDLVRLGHVDVQQPDVPSSLAALPEAMAAVVVPLLLSAGFHVNVDLREDTADLDRPVTVGGALGPDGRLVDLLLRRMHQAGVDPARDTLIFAAAGSSDSSAVQDCQDMAARLQARVGRPVQDAYLSFAEPSVKTAVAQARQTTQGRIVLISYLLAPGYFQNLLERAGADLVTSSLLPQDSTQAPEELVEIILDRFAAGLQELTSGSAASQAAR